MSTRGCIAKPQGDGWAGRYQHFDSYPRGLGQRLWHVYHEYYQGDLARMITEAIDDHPQGWSSYDPVDGTCYCHDPYFATRGDRDPNEQHWIRNEDAKDEALFIEYVYVLALAGLDILVSVPTGQTVHRVGPYGEWNEPQYTWKPLTFIPWNGPEPDWEAIEAKDRALQEAS